MQFDKTIHDTDGDTARVVADSIDTDSVDLWTRQENADVGVYLALTPATARQLARALKRAANVAEGKPAKTKPSKPAELYDLMGDRWVRDSKTGKYTHHYRHGGGPNPALTGWTPDRIRSVYGLREVTS